ncbi:MAG TPA: RNA polymerase sigma factor [Acidimicrobiales bacterium]|jgi:RNA polymerase sigma-70 factor (ECF subfamily)|nr:RNA polymerase sigma factor [Acidimicrobiales bacterium]
MSGLRVVDNKGRVEYHDLDAALRNARNGDNWAIACLFRAIHPSLLHYVRRHAPDAAEELASETWLAAAKGFATFEGDIEEFRAWLFVVARRRIVDHYRYQARRPRLTAFTDQEPTTPSADDLAIEALSTDQAIAALVRDLSADQAEVVMLRVVAGLSVSQVATIMGSSPGSVRVLQHRALRHLGKTWDRGTVTL